MRKEIERLYNDWHWSYAISSIMTDAIVKNDKFWKFVNYCKEHKEEALKFIEEELENGISYIYFVLPYLLMDESMLDEYFETIKDKYTMEQICNIWLNILKNTNGVDYYIEYREYKKYLDDNYIMWNPLNEDDPNITFQEFKKGLRNVDKLERSEESYFTQLDNELKDETKSVK